MLVFVLGKYAKIIKRDITANKILESLKDKKVGVFCDDSNLYHSYQKYGWRVDFEKFKYFLAKFCKVDFINYYIAVPDKSDINYHKTEEFLKKIRQFVSVKEKKLKYMVSARQLIKKGDVDVEIVLDVVRNIERLDAVFVISGDSDFLELRNYIVKDKKKIIVFVGYEENMAWELRQCWHIYLNRIKNEIVLATR